MALTITTHGNAVTVGERPGGGSAFSGGDLENAFGVAWTDVVGLRQGWGTTFRGKEGKGVWFHLPITTPTVVDDAPTRLERVDLFLDVDANVVLRHVHMWDSQRNRFVTRNDVNASGDFGFDVPRTPLVTACSVSMHIFFSRAGNVVFRGARARFA